MADGRALESFQPLWPLGQVAEPRSVGFDHCEGNSGSGRPNGRMDSPRLPPAGGFSAAARPQSLPGDRARDQTDCQPFWPGRDPHVCFPSFSAQSFPTPLASQGSSHTCTHISPGIWELTASVLQLKKKKRHIKKTDLKSRYKVKSIHQSLSHGKHASYIMRKHPFPVFMPQLNMETKMPGYDTGLG